MEIIEAGRGLAEMCYSEVSPMHNLDSEYELYREIASDFEGEIDLMETEPGYLDDLKEETRQYCLDVAKTWKKLSLSEQLDNIKELVDSKIIPLR